jgi:hypothetical protein
MVWSGLGLSGLVWSGLAWSGLVWGALIWGGVVCSTDAAAAYRPRSFGGVLSRGFTPSTHNETKNSVHHGDQNIWSNFGVGRFLF